MDKFFKWIFHTSELTANKCSDRTGRKYSHLYEFPPYRLSKKKKKSLNEFGKQNGYTAEEEKEKERD